MLYSNPARLDSLFSLQERPAVTASLRWIESNNNNNAMVPDVQVSSSLWHELLRLGASITRHPITPSLPDPSSIALSALSASIDAIKIAVSFSSTIVSSDLCLSDPLDPSSHTSLLAYAFKYPGTDDDSTPTLWLSRQFAIDNASYITLVHDDDDDDDEHYSSYQCWVMPVSILSLTKVILNASDHSSWTTISKDPELVSNTLKIGNGIMRIGSTVHVPIHNEATLMCDFYSLRVLSCEPLQQGMISDETTIVIAHLPDLEVDLVEVTVPSTILNSIPSISNTDLAYQVDFTGRGQMTIPYVYLNDIVLECCASPFAHRYHDRWMGVSLAYLVESGLCEGDWIYVKPVTKDQHDMYLVQVFCYPAQPLHQGKLQTAFVTPLLLRNISPKLQWQDPSAAVSIYCPTERIDLDTVTPALEITLARVGSPHSNHRGLLDVSLASLQRMLSKRKRLVCKGDWVALPVDGLESLIKERVVPEYTELCKDLKFISSTSIDCYYFKVTDIKTSQPFSPMAVVDCSMTKIVQAGMVHSRLPENSKVQFTQRGLEINRTLTPSSMSLVHPRFEELVEICSTYLQADHLHSMFPCTVLIHGATGVGKHVLVNQVSSRLGLHIIEENCYDLVREPLTTSLALLELWAERAIACRPSILLLRNLDAACQFIGYRGQQAPDNAFEVKDAISRLLDKISESVTDQNFPTLLFSTATDVDKVHGSVRRLFRSDIKCEIPSHNHRTALLSSLLSKVSISNDVQIDQIATKTAGFSVRDINYLIAAAGIEVMTVLVDAIMDSKSSYITVDDILHAGVPLSANPISKALDKARAAHSDSIGAPRIPNVQWEDIGGLAHVKDAILETIKLPLDHPELFVSGAKRRSGILLYGPPGTGKTLVAKAVATTLSLNFFSVKGPELLDMYIGESEANVRRVFQRARDAKPCVVFFDELDSVAPKRGEKGDSGGVMDRIVSQLLSELDGMSDAAGDSSDLFIIAATNRPDLLDPALLRPGRFDELLYLGLPSDHDAQYKVLTALTRKFNFSPDTNLRDIANLCPFNYTGADFYALCSDALLKAMARTISHVDSVLAGLNSSGPLTGHPYPLTPQYYLEHMATAVESIVLVQMVDFELALNELVPSVSPEELARYERLRDQFEQKSQQPNAVSAKRRDKGKSRAR
ncbi:hypothetical protein BASA50_008174 [Batrachochytrium salamandrivorans]|uniref:Peroxisomal ATPase PEX6 n=1 Tax=Batrachochytrium salamandrivorans TaxID=1357716 RepID=A0ABQ8F4X6_9FUNG|nr:hypothetical protein BASA61_006175 [Batrachochytrium salamandrivorans]KAH6592241.1 hypothetical protein BASA50_008174 [Batrachochytrium salamandrivorans]